MQMERLEKLKTRIKEISCNELRRIYPFQLQEWVGVEERELATFIDELLNVNLMEEKYDFQCDCGNDFTKNWKEMVLYVRNVKENTYQMKLQKKRQFCMK